MGIYPQNNALEEITITEININMNARRLSAKGCGTVMEYQLSGPTDHAGKNLDH